MANEIRMFNASESALSAHECVLPESATPIEKLVERLQFQNPTRAIAFLSANPGVLGQARLMDHLGEHLDDQPNTEAQ
jgi:hypothetical protein